MYGTTNLGGADNSGTVFKIATDGTGFQVIRSFNCNVAGGCNPQAGLIQLGDGFLYGTTSPVSPNQLNSGTLFRIAPDGTGYQVLKSFVCDYSTTNACLPQASVLQLSDGNLYGTALGGGANNEGAVYKIAPNGTGFTLVMSGGCSLANGCEPVAPLSQGMDGNLYGTTSVGGANISFVSGSLFKVAPDGTGYTQLRSFGGFNPELGQPYGGLLQLSDGFLYRHDSDRRYARRRCGL